MNKRMACNEKIIFEINEAINKELSIQLKDCEEFEDPDLLNRDIVECSELCNKLLNNDYFKRSEQYLDKMIAFYRPHSRFADLEYRILKIKWNILCKLDLNNKKKDMSRLFKLIVRSSEDWC